jgi:16S rRNA (cytosine967-C5)-methyltransferase
VAENAKRLGLDIITTANNDATVLVDKWRSSADKVLVDAPCSGLGVLGRRAEARWSKTPQDLLTFPPLQKQILANAAQYVKAGGRLVYSTCTLETAENGAIVQEFLAEHPEYTKIEERQLLPYQDGVDGFYYCLLERSKD